MPFSFVVDASALAKSFLDETHDAAFRMWLGQARSANASLLAPPIIRYELGNTLATAVRRGVDLEARLRRDLVDQALLGFRLVDPHGPEAYAPPLSFYDAGYLALAHETEAKLATYDVRLAAAAAEADVAVVAPGMA